AAHALLLLAIADVRSFRGEPLPPNLSSREIASRPGIPREAAAALDALVRAVEVVLFGGHPADRPLFDACRERYLALHGALARRAA
ncbi:MAG: DUF4129 domain-containing protein, partial [Planctomycetes bacterium]|nr:DUF4129 domain-containing protein [Planctomycetota bacterium]